MLMLPIVNNLAIPVLIFGAKSYIVWSGVQDALTRLWRAYNAVGCFLASGFLGVMYSYVSKQVDRPICPSRPHMANRVLAVVLGVVIRVWRQQAGPSFGSADQVKPVFGLVSAISCARMDPT